jgi:serine/threonine protein kinase
MPLAAGTRLGPYEILGPLGAGGMGEVYRARDTRLDRAVAVKVIPAHLASEAEVRQRFEREARAVSALNHPHICVLHDIGQEGSTYFFVMELLEGETLATRLEQGPLSPDEFFPAAVQIADALAAAHRAGIVHRDLKPGNIVLTRSGAKLLDFGLARATGFPAAAGSGLTQSPTLARPLTAEGTIVGTFQYMAPEQLEGKDADARTDIFAFGAVLYEMATGKRAFEGGSQASLIASIIKETPRPMSEVMPMTPPALDHVVRRCLAKKPDERWQSASDVKHQLEWIRDAGSQAGVPVPVLVHRRHLSRAIWTVAIVSSVATLALGSYLVTHRPPPPQTMRFNLLPPDRQFFDGSQSYMAVSPDGGSLASVVIDSTGASRVFVRRLDSTTAIPVANTEGATHLFWSPDSRHLGFFAGGKLRRVSVADGSVQALADATEARGGSWSVNGDIVFQPAAAGPLMHVRAAGGPVHAVTVVDTANGEDAHRFPYFLPDGKHFLFVSLPTKDNLFDVRVGSLDGKSTPPVARTGGAAVFAPPGFLVYPIENRLVAQRFDAGGLKLEGDAMPLGEDSGQNGGWMGAPGASVSSNGVLVHAAGGWPNSALVWLDRTGRSLGRLPVVPGIYGEGSFSLDGSSLLLTKYAPGGPTSDLWLVNVQRTLATRFTFSASENAMPRFSPDGSQVVFVSAREGRENIYIKPTNSSTEEKRLVDSGALFTKPEAWTPDGKAIVFNTLSRETGMDLWLYDLAGDSAPKALLSTRFNESDADISPDGRWMLYRSNETGRSELYVRSFPEMGEKHRISDDVLGTFDGTLFFWGEWRKDGREILYPGADGSTMVSVEIGPGPGFHAGTPRALFRLPVNTFNVAIVPDGRKFLAIAPDTGFTPPAHSVVLNWTRLLERD